MAHEIDKHRIIGAQLISQQVLDFCGHENIVGALTEWDHEYDIKHINTLVHRLQLHLNNYIIQIPLDDEVITKYDFDNEIKSEVNKTLSSMVQCLLKLLKR